MTEQHAMSAREALDYLVETLQTQCATYQFDGVLPCAIPILTAALDERERLRRACEAFAQWQRPAARDWDNGAIRDEFNALQQQARDAPAPRGRTSD